MPTTTTLGQTYIRRERDPDDPIQTLPCNLLAALPHVRHDKVFIIEDDDWYAPHYLERYLERMKHLALAGESHAIYYRLNPPLWKSFRNQTWASLAATSLHGAKALSDLEYSCRHSSIIDMILWRRCAGRKHVFCRQKDHPLIVQFKGMPGRGGVDSHHRQSRGYSRDAGLHLLSRWIGEELDCYEPFLQLNAEVESARLGA